MPQYIAVIDIGKTDKKVAIYNRKLELVDVAKTNFDEITKDGINFENLPEITPWLLARIKEFAAIYDIAAVSVTTHGATVVLLDENGEPAMPCIAYTTEADGNSATASLGTSATERTCNGKLLRQKLAA